MVIKFCTSPEIKPHGNIFLLEAFDDKQKLITSIKVIADSPAEIFIFVKSLFLQSEPKVFIISDYFAVEA